MPRVILKGEVHTSKSDLKEEKDLIRDRDVDFLILEKNKERAKLKLSNVLYLIYFELFSIAMKIPYVNKEGLEDIANQRGIKVCPTRKNNLEIFKESPLWYDFLSFILSFFLLAYGLFLVYKLPNIPIFIRSIDLILINLLGTIFVFLGMILPVVMARLYEMSNKLKINRDKKIAEKISKFSEKGNVLAILGQRHLPNIEENLDKDISDKRVSVCKGDKYKTIKEIIFPLLKGLIVFSIILPSFMYLLRN